ncbi:acyltransferase domain-containing protein [Micromonospora sp. M12]
MSGTNAHVVVEEAPAGPQYPEPDSELPAPWLLSGHSEVALRAQAARLRSFLDDAGEVAPLAIAATLATGRAALDHRAAVVSRDPAVLRRGLDALADGGTAPGVIRPDRAGGDLAFLFTGQGAQRAGMGQGWRPPSESSRGSGTRRCPCWTPTPYALPTTRPWLAPGSRRRPCSRSRSPCAASGSRGVTPAYLLGHSIGELAAAHVAGVLSLPDACRLVSARAG